MAERNPTLIAALLAAQLGDAALPVARAQFEECRTAREVAAQQMWAEVVGELTLILGDGRKVRCIH
ncbi:hypothetical protein [Reyranella sp. CPCC 100927]|uniref:hypothetical protein n=1 Tax=Reyranella sp. CPCC 100927 TaxID=2599616 RepID=UPI0011B79F94|nr:hypothetical protein [Reyranella sp. CPCC 100927]TWT12652.1 hypothetical protein FQU96_10330 [Reyranella sp. CPCC 100927]